MVDAIELLLAKIAVQALLQNVGALEVVTEGLFNDQATPAGLLLGKFARRQIVVTPYRIPTDGSPYRKHRFRESGNVLEDVSESAISSSLIQVP